MLGVRRMSDALDLWKLWFDKDGDPWNKESEWGMPCFFCGEEHPNHKVGCVYVLAAKLLDQTYQYEKIITERQDWIDVPEEQQKRWGYIEYSLTVQCACGKDVELWDGDIEDDNDRITCECGRAYSIRLVYQERGGG